ncbi:porin [Rhizobiaceae bacterium BDR2-2]|uniref:Porin n=1 Tax=Ectorhizobium quercum TaxID=2965071 RepID=A0AAE3SXJ2_9HYPH|nr:porin [Ectorhizobium quercum]MCX8999099.1 porin [Ectorhizobium quercum]
MNIKSLLIGSAAALAAVSGAQAADAIIAAEPEPVEYVRVCDAFGTGYFYIPGTETCLKLSGYVRVQLNVGTADGERAVNTSTRSDYDVFARGRLNIEAKNDTEYGTLTSYVRFFGRASEGVGDGTNGTELELAYIDLAGFRVGKFYSVWDDILLGETDTLASNSLFASARYEYAGEAFTAGLSLDEITYSSANFGGYANVLPGSNDANLGIAPYLSASFGGVKLNVNGGYDTDREEGAVQAKLTADLGPGTFQLAGVYASGANAYYYRSEWTVAAAYAFKATEKLTITPAFQYFSDVAFVDGVDAYRVGLTAAYKVTDGLNLLATVNYYDQDRTDDETWGFLRLQRDF